MKKYIRINYIILISLFALNNQYNISMDYDPYDYDNIEIPDVKLSVLPSLSSIYQWGKSIFGYGAKVVNNPHVPIVNNHNDNEDYGNIEIPDVKLSVLPSLNSIRGAFRNAGDFALQMRDEHYKIMDEIHYNAVKYTMQLYNKKRPSCSDVKKGAISLVTKPINGIKSKIKSSFNEGLDEFDNRLRKNLFIAFGLGSALIGAYFTCKYLSKFISDKINKIGTFPKLVIDTSLSKADKLSQENIKKIILPENLKLILSRMSEFIERIAKFNINNPKVKYGNILIYGPSGMGKTKFAKEISKHSGVDYVRISGLSFDKFNSEKDAMSAINEFFTWVKNSKKHLILIIDDVELFLYKRESMQVNNRDYKIMNRFLNNLNSLNNKFMVLMCTKNKEQLDTNLLNKINAYIEIKLPDVVDRFDYLDAHKDMLLNSSQDNEDFLESVSKILTTKRLNTIAKDTQGLSNKDLEEIIRSLMIESHINGDKVLTKSIIESVVHRGLRNT